MTILFYNLKYDGSFAIKPVNSSPLASKMETSCSFLTAVVQMCQLLVNTSEMLLLFLVKMQSFINDCNYWTDYLQQDTSAVLPSL